MLEHLLKSAEINYCSRDVHDLKGKLVMANFDTSTKVWGILLLIDLMTVDHRICCTTSIVKGQKNCENYVNWTLLGHFREASENEHVFVSNHICTMCRVFNLILTLRLQMPKFNGLIALLWFYLENSLWPRLKCSTKKLSYLFVCPSKNRKQTANCSRDLRKEVSSVQLTAKTHLDR